MKGDPRILEMALSPDSRLDDILALAGSRYPVVFETVALGALNIDLLQIADPLTHLLGAWSLERMVRSGSPSTRTTG